VSGDEWRGHELANSLKERAFIATRRCIYSGLELVPDDPELGESPEHIIPLSLGGSNGFITNDVSRKANNRAGNEIDDKVASLFAVTILRNKFSLAGHRGRVPDVRMEGTCLDMVSHPSATMIVDAAGSVQFDIAGTQRSAGQAIQISGSEEWVSQMLSHRLRQARHHGANLLTPFGDITDEEDIRVAVAIAAREAGREFKSELVLDLRAHQRALQHFMVKVGLCLGHRVFGPAWSFGPDGILLRRALFPDAAQISKVRGTLYAKVDGPIKDMLDIAPDRHSLAVYRFKDKAVAYVALFGGSLGIAAIVLSQSARKYRQGADRNAHEGHLYQLLGISGGKPTLKSKSLDEMLTTVRPGF
jgi:hypothetical protein